MHASVLGGRVYRWVWWPVAVPLGVVGAAGAAVLLGPGALILVAVFVLIQRRAAHPLLPLRVLADRSRGGAYLAITLTAIGMCAVSLFLTYYMQQILQFSPLLTGVAFLPMVVGIVFGSTFVVPWLLPRVGPRPLIPPGELLGGIGLVLMWRLHADSSYAIHLLPALIVMGFGMGLIFAAAFNTATTGADQRDAGVASALVNTGQQIGGALGTALLNTVATGVTADYVAAHPPPNPAVLREAAVAGDTPAFLNSAAVFFLAALISAVVLPSGPIPADAATGRRDPA